MVITQAIATCLEAQKLLPPQNKIELSLEKQKGTSTYCYTPPEVTAIISHCRSDPKLHWLCNVTTALATTGLRISELVSLRWTDLSSNGTSLELTDESGRSDTDDAKRRTIKTGKNRVFPVHPDLAAILQKLQRTGREIFRGPRGGKLKPDYVLRRLKEDVLYPLAGANHPGLSSRFTEGKVHSFRHYFCSICANSGVSEQMVMRWLGHSSSEMVQRYYHLHDDEAHRQMSQINFLGSASTQSTDE